MTRVSREWYIEAVHPIRPSVRLYELRATSLQRSLITCVAPQMALRSRMAPRCAGGFLFCVLREPTRVPLRSITSRARRQNRLIQAHAVRRSAEDRVLLDEPCVHSASLSPSRALDSHAATSNGSSVEKRAAVATAVLVVIMPDCGRACMSKIFNDGRMTANGFIGGDKRKDTVGDALRSKQPLPSIITVIETAMVRGALDAARRDRATAGNARQRRRRLDQRRRSHAGRRRPPPICCINREARWWAAASPCSKPLLKSIALASC